MTLPCFSHDLFGNHVGPMMQVILLKLQVFQIRMVSNDVVDDGFLLHV